MRETRETRVQLRTMVTAALAVVMMILAVGLTTLVSHAEEGRVTASSVKIRESADTNSDMLSGAMQGDVLTITGEVTGTDGKVWYQVTFEGDRTGYIRSDLMEKVSGTGTTTAASNSDTSVSGVQAIQPISATVTGEQVRVRSLASTSGSIVTTVQKGVVLTVTGTAADSEGRVWYQISYSDTSGQVTGFVREDFVSLEGEIVPADQVSEEPEEPDTEDPAQTQEPVTEQEHKDFETALEEDGWYLLDYTTNQKYSIEEIFDTAEKYEEMYNDSQAKQKSMKTIMIILVILVILLALGATLLFFKIRDMMDAAYFEEVEQETIRKRQGQRSAARATMPTVGAGTKPTAGSQTRPTGSGQNKPAGSAQNRPAGSGQQTRPSGNGQTRPAVLGQQTRTAGAQTRPAGNGQAKPTGGAQKSAGDQTVRSAKSAQTTAGSVEPAAKPAAQSSAKPSQQPKNFMTEDDEFEFEFLNWDGEEDN